MPFCFLIKAVRKRSRGGFVDQAQHFQSGDASGIFGRLALRVVEISRNGDDSFGNGSAEIALCIALELPKDQRRNLGRSKRFISRA